MKPINLNNDTLDEAILELRGETATGIEKTYTLTGETGLSGVIKTIRYGREIHLACQVTWNMETPINIFLLPTMLDEEDCPKTDLFYAVPIALDAENLLGLGYVRIYNTGQIVFVLNENAQKLDTIFNIVYLRKE